MPNASLLVLTLNRSIVRATSLKGRLGTTYCGIELLVLTYSSRNFYILLILENQGPRGYDLRTHTRSGLGLSCTISVALKIAPRTRKFAPYVGVAYDGKFGETADFTRAEGGIVNDLRFVFGIRLWY
jgi:hypothetical protein